MGKPQNRLPVGEGLKLPYRIFCFWGTPFGFRINCAIVLILESADFIT
jgi:hypothetical protein